MSLRIQKLVISVTLVLGGALLMAAKAPPTPRLSTIPSVVASGLPWMLELEGEEYFAVFAADRNLRIPLRFEILAPQLLSWEKSPRNADVWILSYESAGSGTQIRYRELRKILVHTKLRRILGDFLAEATPVAGGPKPSVPLWNWEAKRLRIDDSTLDESRVVEFDEQE